MKNIYLIGFMGTGKSSVAKELSKYLSLEVIDMDMLIEEKENISIKEIFAQKGEAYFRECESRLLEEIAKKENKIIS